MEGTRDDLVEWLGAVLEESVEGFSNPLEVCVVRVHGQNLIIFLPLIPIFGRNVNSG